MQIKIFGFPNRILHLTRSFKINKTNPESSEGTWGPPVIELWTQEVLLIALIKHLLSLFRESECAGIKWGSTGGRCLAA